MRVWRTTSGGRRRCLREGVTDSRVCVREKESERKQQKQQQQTHTHTKKYTPFFFSYVEDALVLPFFSVFFFFYV